MTGDIYNGAQSSSGLKVIMVALLPIIALAVVIVTLFFSWRVCRGRIRGDSSSSSASIESKEAPLLPPRVSPTPSIDAETILKHIQLLEIVAVRHAGGCVRKAKLENEVSEPIDDPTGSRGIVGIAMFLRVFDEFVQYCSINLSNECLSTDFKDASGCCGSEDFHIPRKITLGKGKGHIHIDRFEVPQSERAEVRRCTEARNNFQN